MKMHKNILVSCFIEESPQAMPLSTALLKSYVHTIKNLQVVLFQFTLEEDIEETVVKILSEEPDSIGFSLYLWNSPFFEKLASIIKKKSPEIILFAGGAEVTASYDRLLKTSLFDYLLPGEGEIPYRKLMRSLQSGITLQERLFPQQHETDINRIPSPYLSGDLNPAAYEGLLWELSRGCPFNCAFCCESRGVGGVRYYDMDRLQGELQLFEDAGVEQIWILDPTFNIKKERALEILSLIEKIAPHIHFIFEVRAELLDEELAKAFSRIHCSLQIGLQSCRNRVLKKLNRSIDRDQFSSRIALLNKFGVVFGLDLIYGLPGDSPEGFEHSLDFAIEQIPNHLDIFRLSVFPGTELYERAETLGLQFNRKPPYEVLESGGFTPEDILRAEKLSDAADLFYNRGKAAPWLLPLLTVLHMKSSVFFKHFSLFLASTDKSKDPIAETQSDFLIQFLSDKSSDQIMALTIDLLHYHHLYNTALYAEEQQNGYYLLEEMEALIFNRTSNLQSGIFSYDVTLYAELGMFDFNWFVDEFEREVSYGMIFNINGEILTMGIEKIYFQFIQSLDGKKTVKDILDIINTEADELREFIGFLAENGLIYSL